jgi:hypothetical protein
LNKARLTPSEVEGPTVGLGIDQLGLEGDGRIENGRTIGRDLNFRVTERVDVRKDGQEDDEGRRHRTKALPKHFRRRLLRKSHFFFSISEPFEISFSFLPSAALQQLSSAVEVN